MATATLERPTSVRFNFRSVKKALPDATNIERGKKRYIEGVASGPRVDGHGERMTPACIKSFFNQANSGDVLLYIDEHGIRSTEDIGILEHSKILDNGDWWISVRIYDDSDEVPQATKEKCNQVWAQMNGLPPYRSPRKKGFSIEGKVPNGGIQQMNDNGGERVMNDVILDGILLVPEPAYQDSIAHAVYKALGEPGPWVGDKIASSIESSIDDSEDNYINNMRLEDAFEEQLKKIHKNTVHKAYKLQSLYRSYAKVFKSLNDSGLPTASKQEKVQKGLHTNRVLLEKLVQVKKAAIPVKGGNMLSPEESALVKNITSLLEQLGQINAGGDMVDQTMGQMQPQQSPSDDGLAGLFGDSTMKSEDNEMAKVKKMAVNKAGADCDEPNEVKKEDMNQADDEFNLDGDEASGMPADAASEPPPNAPVEDEELAKALKVLKAFVAKSGPDMTTPPENEDAEMTAEERYDAGKTNITEEAEKMVAKAAAILKARKAQQAVAKSLNQSGAVAAQLMQLNQKLTNLARVTKALMDRQDESSSAVNSLLEGFGFAETIRNGMEAGRGPAAVDRRDPGNLGARVAKSQGQHQDVGVGANRDAHVQSVRKSLRDQLSSLLA